MNKKRNDFSLRRWGTPTVVTGAVQAIVAYPEDACIATNLPNLGGNGNGTYENPYGANQGFQGMAYYAWPAYIVPPNAAPFFWVPNAAAFTATNNAIANGSLY